MCRHVLLALVLVAAGAPLARAARVRIVDASGPLRGAAVRWDGGQAVADEAGWVEVPDGAPAACATAPGAMPVVLEAIADPQAPVMLRAGATVRGVLQTADGAPAPGIMVRFASDDPSSPCARRATSGADGAYAIDGLPLQTGVALLLDAPAGFIAPEPPARARTTTAASPARLDLRVLPASLATARVAGPDGKPLAGAVVRVDTDWSRLALDPHPGAAFTTAIDEFRGTSDAEGVVALPKLARGATWRIVAEHPQLAPSSTLAPLTSATADVKLRLMRGGTITARVVDESGIPWRGIVARLSSATERDADLVPASAPSTAEGLLEIGRVPAGRYELELRGPGARPALLRGVVVREGAITDAGDAVLRPGVALAGTVLGEGAPIAGASLTAWTRAEGAPVKLREKTDTAGAFRSAQAREGLKIVVGPGE